MSLLAILKIIERIELAPKQKIMGQRNVPTSILCNSYKSAPFYHIRATQTTVLMYILSCYNNCCNGQRDFLWKSQFKSMPFSQA